VTAARRFQSVARPAQPAVPQPSASPGGQGQAGLRRPTASSKTGTPIVDSPLNIQIVSGDVIATQAAYSVERALRNVSGVREASGSTYGFFDRFTVRGLDQMFLNDGLPDGLTINGYARSLLGIERIEVLKGPGSALFGSGAPGGTINFVRRRPSDAPAYAIEGQAGSFNTFGSTVEATGPTSLAKLNYRIDGGYYRTDGFRDLKGERGDFLQGYQWNPNPDHTVFVTLDYLNIEAVADNYGIPFQGTRLINVPTSNKYYTPFGDTTQQVVRTSFEDKWAVSNVLTINNRFAVLDRDVSILRNSGGTVATNSVQMTGRQLRQQRDDALDMIYQLEPIWRFSTGSVGHTLLTGVEWQNHNLDSTRRTAALPNIANIFNPVIPEKSLAALAFVPNFSRDITANYWGAYAHDQIDVTDQLKVRVGGRADKFSTEINDRFTSRVSSRDDVRYSWQVGAVYKLTPAFAPFVGASRSNFGVLTAEADNAANRPPESALQYEVGTRIDLFGDRGYATVAAFDVTRSDFLQSVGGEQLAVGEQRTRGFDVDFTWKPVPGALLIANYAYQTAKLLNVPAAPATQGKVPLGVPTNSANLWASYELQYGPLQYFGAGVGVTYRDRIYADDLNLITIPSFVTTDLVLTYRPPGYEASLAVLNLTDALNYRYALFSGAFPGNPRTFVGRLKVRF